MVLFLHFSKLNVQHELIYDWIKVRIYRYPTYPWRHLNNHLRIVKQRVWNEHKCWGCTCIKISFLKKIQITNLHTAHRAKNWMRGPQNLWCTQIFGTRVRTGEQSYIGWETFGAIMLDIKWWPYFEHVNQYALQTYSFMYDLKYIFDHIPLKYVCLIKISNKVRHVYLNY